MAKRGKSDTPDLKTELKLSKQLVMTPQLQLAIRLLATPTAKLPVLVADWQREHPEALVPLGDGEPDPADAGEPGDSDDDAPPPLRLLAEPPLPADPDGRVADVWVFGNPPEALANRAALLRLRVSTQVAIEHVTAARWFVRALRQRLQAYQKIVQAVVTLRPELATVPLGTDVKPVKKRELADLVGMHESTIGRVASACVVQNRRAVFGLEHVVR